MTVTQMKAGLSAAYSVFIMALTNVSVITLLHFFVTSITFQTGLPDWLAVIGIIIVIYAVGIAMTFAGLHTIEKLFERNKNRAVLRHQK